MRHTKWENCCIFEQFSVFSYACITLKFKMRKLALLVLILLAPAPQQVYQAYMPMVVREPGKAGVAWAWRKYAEDTDVNVLGIQWYTDWAINEPVDLRAEYIPYFACETYPYHNPDANYNYWNQVEAVLGADYQGDLLFLNEPTLSSQCLRTPAEAVDLLARLREEVPHARIIGPNMSHRDYLNEWAWLQAFHEIARQRGVKLPEVGGIHSYLEEDASRLIESYFNLPYAAETVWVSEFGNCQEDVVADMLQTYSSDSRIERYAYFAPRLYMDVVPAPLRCLTLFSGTGTALTPQGEHYRDIKE